jgi:hypothetical protein
MQGENAEWPERAAGGEWLAQAADGEWLVAGARPARYE